MTISLGAAKLPMRHISIRVPWHDSGWDGTVCRHPIGNRSCTILKNIAQNKDDEAEELLAGESWKDISERRLPPCVREHGGFMSQFPLTLTKTHPYKRWSPGHKHLAPTPYRMGPYTADAIPFNWTLREGAKLRAEMYDIRGYDESREKRADELAGRRTNWLQTKQNQLALLDTFFGAVEPERSLCFFYAKQTPLVEDPRRVIVGVGRVTGKGMPIEYEYDGDGELRAILWEREIRHSIRPDMGDGFLLPYQELLDLQAPDPTIELTDYVAFAPDDAFDSFSYGSEHVDHDQAIAALLNCAEALRRIEKVLSGDWERALKWIDARINELWKLRGPCPGLGSALSAYGLEHGTFLAYELSEFLQDNEDPWPIVESMFADRSQLGEQWERRISATLAENWPNLPEHRRTLLKLISRFNLNADQARRFYNQKQREDAGINASDADLLENPYLLFEMDRHSKEPIRFQTVDRGVFPDPVVRDAHPLPTISQMGDPADPRRSRALMITVLETASGQGHTVRSQNQIIDAIENLNLEPACPISSDLMPLIESKFDGLIERVEMADGEPAYQLARLSETGALIRATVLRRGKGRRHRMLQNWRRLIDGQLGDEDLDESEERAREEKAAALKEVFSSRFSVLIGPAGTGKTLLLSFLCNQSKVNAAGVLLLAPTGKARVQLERRTGIRAQTIAQYLIQENRQQYKPETGAYILSHLPAETRYATVVIDEASMLTEDQLAAVLSALDREVVERIILVGDPRQLPPIGAGRPFVDIMSQLRPDEIEGQFPRVAPGYAELTVIRRTKDAEGRRDDVLLAQWFSGQPLDAGADEIWSRVASETDTPTLRFVRWNDSNDLHEIILQTLVEELGLANTRDQRGFEATLGGKPADGMSFFNRGEAQAVENWQILSPVNLRAHGVDELNLLIQRRFRKDMLKLAHSWGFKIPAPFGPEHIVYGDKVIGIRNQRRRWIHPRDNNALYYVANGEIGLVTGETAWRQDWKPRKLQVEFSTQFEYEYDYFESEFVDEGDPPLRLAYAITIHKSQGSEFGKTFIVLPDPLPMMSRELLYTALTRQQEKVIVLHQGDLLDLKQFDQVKHSEIAQRQTNIFGPPKMEAVEGTFLEDRLIHRTTAGIAVRSKSEVIIANQLTHNDVSYIYEQKLEGDGVVLYPDFTIRDGELGITVYWEHLGLMHDPAYRARWERKKAWYRRNGILPYSEDPGAERMLVVTEDTEVGGIDSAAIDRIIKEIFPV